MLPYAGAVGRETRRLYWHRAFDPQAGVFADELNSLPLPVTRLLSFGTCNVACPYCKRDMQFIGEDGIPLATIDMPLEEVIALCERACERGEIVRFSGGDPIMFPRVCVDIAQHLQARYGAQVSIAHNGSGPAFVRRIHPLMSSAALDLKGVPERMGEIMGVPAERGAHYYERALESIAALQNSPTCVTDVRTPIFGDTSEAEIERLALALRPLMGRTSFWTFRLYKAVEGCAWPVPSRERGLELMRIASALLPGQWIGMRAKWHQGGMLFVRDGEVIDDSLTPGEERAGSGNTGLICEVSHAGL